MVVAEAVEVNVVAKAGEEQREEDDRDLLVNLGSFTSKPWTSSA